MKRIVIPLLLLLATLVGCDNEIYHWEFEQGYEKVAKIQIVEFRDPQSGFVIVKELDIGLVETLYRDIQSLEMERYGTNLSSPSGYCFVIKYENGNYDIIAKKESKHVKYNDEGKPVEYNSWLCCVDEEQFDKLIDKYLDS